MTKSDQPIPPWWATGLLFENCNCEGICPGHIHFSNDCTHERCMGYWAIEIDSGFFGQVDLSGLRCVVAFDSPQKMINGEWTEAIIVDEAASQEQLLAIEAILTGSAGGPWEILDRFVEKRLPTKQLPIEIQQVQNVKKLKIGNLIKSTVTPLVGTAKNIPVTIENMFNQIHGSSQVIARGETNFTDDPITINTSETHALISTFRWEMVGQ